jgi:hypothetical protein
VVDLLDAIGLLTVGSAAVLGLALRLDSTEHHRRLRRETRRHRRSVRNTSR